jgi:hypothetical protein
MSMRLSPAVISAVFALLLIPGCDLALSLKWPTEGSYVHETAHLLFGAAMLFFIHEIYHAGLQRLRGFRFLIWAWAFLALWNFDAFFGHWIEWTLANPVITGEGLSRQLLMSDTHTWLFYITKIDHFLLLPPAFYLFYRGLKTLAREPRPEGSGGQ